MIFGYRRSTCFRLDQDQIRGRIEECRLKRLNMNIREKPEKIKAVNLKTEM